MTEKNHSFTHQNPNPENQIPNNIQVTIPESRNSRFFWFELGILAIGIYLEFGDFLTTYSFLFFPNLSSKMGAVRLSTGAWLSVRMTAGLELKF